MNPFEIRESFRLEQGSQHLFGMFHAPLERETFPLVILLHGFASSKLGTNRAWVRLAEYLTQAGIGCVRFDFRGCGDSEGSLSEMSVEDYLADVRLVYEHFQEYERIGLFGSSFGGALAALAAAQLPVQSLALWAPIASGELWFRDQLAAKPELSNQPEVFATFRGIALSREYRDQFAAMNAAAQLPDVPLLHLHGAADEIVPVHHQEAYRKVREGANARFITYPHAGHALGAQSIFPEVAAEVVSWYTQTL